MKYREYKFSNFGKAKLKQLQIKKFYGYKPSIARIITKTGKRYYSLIQPIGLKRIDRIERKTSGKEKIYKIDDYVRWL